MQKKILIIEDEVILGDMYITKFKSEGFEVFLARNGEDGIKISAKEKPDLILLDILMPGITGFGVLEKLKQNKETKNIPVLILTNLSDPPNIEKSFQLGAKEFLLKTDYTPQELVKKIEKILEFFKL